MADLDTIKISELTAATSVDTDDLKLIVQDGETKKVEQADDISSFVSSDADNAISIGSDDKLFIVDATNADNISSGNLDNDRLTDSGVVAGSYTASNVTVNSKGVITAVTSGTGAGLPTNYITGLLPSNGTDTDHEIDISTGKARDSDDGEDIEVTSVLTADIEVSGANGLDTGSVAADSWYHIFVCNGTSGVCSLLSLSVTAPTLPSGYDDVFRRVGSVLTDSSSNIVNGVWFNMSGGAVEFVYNTLITEFITTSSSLPRQDLIISTPSGVSTNSKLMLTRGSGGPTTNSYYRAYVKNSGVGTSVESNVLGAGDPIIGATGYCRTDESSTIEHEANNLSADYLRLDCFGYIDERIA